MRTGGSSGDAGPSFEVQRLSVIRNLMFDMRCSHVLFGPRGSGKSTCALQFARSFERSLVIDCATTGVEGVAERITLAPGYSDSTTRGPELVAGRTCVVFDDADFRDPGLLVAVRECARKQATVVVVAESLCAAPDEVLTQMALVGPDDLLMSVDEISEMLAACSSTRSTHEDVRRIHSATRGYPALVLPMYRAISRERAGATRPAAEVEHWLRLMSRELGLAAQATLGIVGWLERYSYADLQRCGIPSCDLDAAAAELPFLLPLRDASGGRSRLDPLIADAARAVCGATLDAAASEGILAVLGQREDWAGSACFLSRTHADAGVIAHWLRSWGRELLGTGNGPLARDLVERISPSTLLSDCDLLLLAAEIARDCGDYEECIARSSAALTLSRHTRDREVEREAMLSAVRAHLHLGRHSDAAALAESLLRLGESTRGHDSPVLTALAVAATSLNCGFLDEATSLMEQAYLSVSQRGITAATRAKAVNGMGVLMATVRADHSGAVTLLAPILDSCDLMQTDRWMISGNVACGLMEMGRTVRSERMFAQVLCESADSTLPDIVSAYLPFKGAACAARGATEEARRSFERGIAEAVHLKDSSSAAISRLYFSTFLRSLTRGEESLVEAEAAADHLAVSNAMGYYAFASVEVAASLLHIGDAVAAGGWLDVARQSRLWQVNPGLRLRAAMVVAASQAGNHRAAADLLLEHREHVLSGNSNWQIAMYIRAFPELLGAFALAIEPAELPAHMLQMILPEHAERSLLATRAWLPAETWREIGVRLLGAADFATFVERDGRPLCRVRLFGGLEVNVGGRIIRERDWKKRKARLLFAMLVTRHGNDVARDQVFDHLWPEMDEERAKNNLYVAWSAMKAALMGGEPGRCPYVESVGGVCRVVSENVRSDVDEFDSAVAAADVARKAGDVSAELAAYRRISDAYRGDLLPGDVYDDWFAQLRGQYRVAFCDAMVHAAELSIDADKPVEGAAYVRRAIQADPLREDLYQMALRCQIASGQRSGAIETYQQCRTRLSEDLGLDPSVETRALYDRILAMEERPDRYTRELLED